MWAQISTCPLMAAQCSAVFSPCKAAVATWPVPLDPFLDGIVLVGNEVGEEQILSWSALPYVGALNLRAIVVRLDKECTLLSLSAKKAGHFEASTEECLPGLGDSPDRWR